MRTFDFGLFLPIANDGMIASTAHQYMPTFTLNRAIALAAEELDYDFIFSMTKCGAATAADAALGLRQESFSLMSGPAAITDRFRPRCFRRLPRFIRCGRANGDDFG